MRRFSAISGGLIFATVMKSTHFRTAPISVTGIARTALDVSIRILFLAVIRVDRGSAPHISPVGIRAKAFDCHQSARLTLNRDRQFFPTRLSISDVSKMPNRCNAGHSKRLAFLFAQAVEVFFERHTGMIFTVWCCRQHQFVNSPNGYNVA